MRIISLDLLLGTPRLRRRIDAELALLQRDRAVVEDSTRQLRAGVIAKATSLPALAAAVATGFVTTKLASRPRRPRPEGETEHETEHKPNAALAASTSLAAQFLMPLVIGWMQARFAPPAPPRDEEPETFPTEQ